MLGDNPRMGPGDLPPYRDELPPPLPPPYPPVEARYTAPSEDRTLGDLFSDLSRDFRTLVRQEIDLAKVESTEKAKKAAKHVGFIAAGGFVAYAGFVVLLVGVAYLLGTFLPMWLAALIVGAAAAVAGYALVQSGLSGLKNTDFSLKHTAESIKEDQEWLKQEVK